MERRRGHWECDSRVKGCEVVQGARCQGGRNICWRRKDWADFRGIFLGWGGIGGGNGLGGFWGWGYLGFSSLLWWS